MHDLADEERDHPRDVVSVRRRKPGSQDSPSARRRCGSPSGSPPPRRRKADSRGSFRRRRAGPNRSCAAARSPNSRRAPSTSSAFRSPSRPSGRRGCSSFDPSRIPAWLAPVCGREIGLPLDEPVRAGREPARHLRRMTVAERSLEHWVGEAVDLDEDDPGPVGTNLLARAPGHPLDHAQRVRVVVVDAEGDLEHERRRRRGQSTREGPAERVDHDRVADRCRRRSRERPQSRTRTSTNPLTTVNGSRTRATTGTTSALRTPMTRDDGERAEHAVDAKPRQQQRRGQEPSGCEIQPTSRVRIRSSGRRTTHIDVPSGLLGSLPCGVATPVTTPRLLRCARRRSASAFRCWSSPSSVASRTVWSRRRKSRATRPVVRLLRRHQRPSVSRLEGVHVDRLDSERRARPGDPAQRLDVLDRRRDRPRPRLPAEGRRPGRLLRRT